jgi:hypothetical protein
MSLGFRVSCDLHNRLPWGKSHIHRPPSAPCRPDIFCVVLSIHRSVGTFVRLRGSPSFYFSGSHFATIIALTLEPGWTIFAASVRVATAIIAEVCGLVTTATAFWV